MTSESSGHSLHAYPFCGILTRTNIPEFHSTLAPNQYTRKKSNTLCGGTNKGHIQLVPCIHKIKIQPSTIRNLSPFLAQQPTSNTVERVFFPSYPIALTICFGSTARLTMAVIVSRERSSKPRSGTRIPYSEIELHGCNLGKFQNAIYCEVLSFQLVWTLLFGTFRTRWSRYKYTWKS